MQLLSRNLSKLKRAPGTHCVHLRCLQGRQRSLFTKVWCSQGEIHRDIQKVRHRQQINPSLGKANMGDIWCEGPWIFAAGTVTAQSSEEEICGCCCGQTAARDLELASCLTARLLLREGETLTLQEQFS